MLKDDLLYKAGVTEYYLKPGDFFWGDGDVRVHTILGSCVSVTFWHPVLKAGGICHYLLPLYYAGQAYDGRFGDYILEVFRSKALMIADLSEFEIKVFGGARMYSSDVDGRYPDVGSMNIRIAEDFFSKYNIKVKSKSLGGSVSRKLIFTMWDGNVWLRERRHCLSC